MHESLDISNVPYSIKNNVPGFSLSYIFLVVSRDISDWLSGRCLACCKLERYAEAVRDATASLEMKPDETVASDTRGYARLKLGQIEDAIADFEAAVHLALNLERPRELLANAREMADGF